MENSSDGPLNGFEGEAVGGSGILGFVCTRFVRKPGTHGYLRISGIPRMSKLRFFNAQRGFDSRHHPKN
jgi:energy-converting hydrogenase Eha subunit G